MRRCRVTILGLVASGLGSLMAWGQSPARGPRLDAGWTKTEKWTWSQILRGDPRGVDLDRNCPDKHPEPADRSDTRWRSECRSISAAFLHDLLTRSPWRESVPHPGVLIRGARVVGNLDLANARLVRAVGIGASQMVGTVVLQRAWTEHVISLPGTLLTGEFNASGIRTSSDLIFSGAIFQRQLDMIDADVGGGLDLTGVTIDGPVRLARSRVKGFVDLRDAAVGGELDCESVQVDGTVFMNAGVLESASFAGKIVFKRARLGSNFDLRGATLADLDLTSASVGGDLLLGPIGGTWTQWRRKTGEASTLKLVNARVNNLADDQTTWPLPGHLQLDGFTFHHLGGSEGDSGTRMRNRGMKWWDNWARLDTQYSPTPYGQLSGLLTAMGDRGAANEIQYLGRQREREDAWVNRRWGTWLGLTLLWTVAGYGIGLYTFYVLVWVALFTAISGTLLWLTVPACRDTHRGRLWCVGASLSRLLPGIEINKEYTDFFNDPERRHLGAWQSHAFSTVGVIGWVLGAILVFALSGLLQGRG